MPPHQRGPAYPAGWPPRSPAGAPLASFGDRFLAYLIDTAIFVAVILVLMIPMMFIWLNRMNNSISGMSSTVRPDGTVVQPAPGDFLVEFFLPLLLLQAVLMVVMLMLYYVYFVELMFRTGQTVGKRVMKLRTVPLDPTARLNRSMAARRYLVQFVAGGLVPFFNYLDGLWQLWDKPYQQCLHDKFAKTLVVKVPG